jgi:hypothetical protein
MANEDVFIHDIPLSVFADYFAKKNEQDAIEANRRYKPLMGRIKMIPREATFKSGSSSVTLMVNDSTGAFLNDAGKVADVTKLTGVPEISSISIGSDADAYALTYDCYMRPLFGGVSFYPYFGVIRGEYYYSVSPVTTDGVLSDFIINAGSGGSIETENGTIAANDERLVSVRFGGTIDLTRMKAKDGGLIIDISAEDADGYSTAYYSIMSDGYEIGRIYRLPPLMMQRRDDEGYFLYEDEYLAGEDRTVRLLESYDSPFMAYHKSMRSITAGSDLTAAATESAGETAYSIKPSLSKSEPANEWLMSIQQTGESQRTTISALMPYSIISPTMTDAEKISTSITSATEVAGYAATGTGYGADALGFITSALELSITTEWLYDRDKGRYGIWGLSDMISAAEKPLETDFIDCVTYLIMMWMLLRHRCLNNYYYCLSDSRKWAGSYDLTATNVAYFIWYILNAAECKTVFPAKSAEGKNDSFDNFIYKIRDRLYEVAESQDKSMALVAKFVRASGNGKNDFKTTYYNIVYMFNDDKLKDYYDGCAFAGDDGKSRVNYNAAWESILTYLKDNLMTKSYSTNYSTITVGDENASAAGMSLPIVKVTETGEFASGEGIFPMAASSCVMSNEKDKLDTGTKGEIMAYIIDKKFKVSSDTSSIRYSLSHCDMNDVEMPSGGSAANAIVTVFDSNEMADEGRLKEAGVYARLQSAAAKSRNRNDWSWFDVLTGGAADHAFCARFMAAIATTGQGISATRSAASALFDDTETGKGKYYSKYARYAFMRDLRFMTGFAEINGMPYKYVFYPGTVQSMPGLPVLKMISLPNWLREMTDYYNELDARLDHKEATMVGIKTKSGDSYSMRYMYCTYSQGVSSAIGDGPLSDALYSAKDLDGIVSAFSNASLLKYNGAMSSVVKESGRMYLTLKKSLMSAVDSMFASESRRVFSGLVSDECSMDAHLYGIESGLMPLYKDDPKNRSDAERSPEEMSFSYVQPLAARSSPSSSAISSASESALKPGDESEIARSVQTDSPFYKIGRYSDYGTDAEARARLISGAKTMMARQKMRSVGSIRASSKSDKVADEMGKHAAAATIKSNFVDLLAGFAYHGDGLTNFGRAHYRDDYDLHFKDKIAHVAKADRGFEWDMPTGGADGILLSFSNGHPKESSDSFMAEFRRQKGVS